MASSSLLNFVTETRDQFFARTYWPSSWNRQNVFVFQNQVGVGPAKVIPQCEALKYLNTLPIGRQVYSAVVPYSPLPKVKCDHDQMLRVSEEELGKKEDSVKWICSSCGEVIHHVTAEK